MTGALPGYSAFEQVEQGDLLRAVTAYAAVAGDAPMWQQAASPLRAHPHPHPNPRPSSDLDLNPSTNPNTEP